VVEVVVIGEVVLVVVVDVVVIGEVVTVVVVDVVSDEVVPDEDVSVFVLVGSFST
jgi:hypothetical protein